MSESSTSIVLEYQLTETDVRNYCLCARFGKCWQICLKRKLSIAFLTVLALFFVGICYVFHTFRTGTLALGMTLIILGLLVWARQAWADRRVCRLARDLSLPCEIRLVISPEGIVKEPGIDPDDLGRRFRWSEVVEIGRIDGLTIIRLRPAGGVLIVPDRAFSNIKAGGDFAENAQAWHEAAPSGEQAESGSLTGTRRG